MFWLLGGQAIAMALLKDAKEGTFLYSIKQQFTHVKWEGFHCYDFIFPLFLFLIGMSVPLSINKRLARGDPKRRIFRHALARFGWMVFFGWCVNGKLLTYDPQQMQLSYSVLMMLGFGYLIAVSLTLWATLRTQIVVTTAILIGYWVLQMFVPVPGHVPGKFVEGAIFSDWFYDQTIGRLGKPWASPLGRGWPISLWAHGATAMLGVFASRLLQSPLSAPTKVRRLLLIGLVFAVVGWLWSFHFPIVKRRWTSSYVLWCGGLSYLLMALFYWVIDINGWRRWAGLFIAIGSNSILAYLISSLFMGGFASLATTLFGGLSVWMSSYWHGVFLTTAKFSFAWLLLIYLRRQQLYLRL